MARIFVEKQSFFAPVAPRIASPEETKIVNELIKREGLKAQENMFYSYERFFPAATMGFVTDHLPPPLLCSTICDPN